jgi:DNA modification methylase
MNTLYYGDNLKILREHIRDESVDLVHLDPPFNSNRNYNVLFNDEPWMTSRRTNETMSSQFSRQKS